MVLESESTMNRDAFIARFNLCDNLGDYANPVAIDISTLGTTCKKNELNYKSGGQIDSGTPLSQRFSASVANTGILPVHCQPLQNGLSNAVVKAQRTAQQMLAPLIQCESLQKMVSRNSLLLLDNPNPLLSL